MPYWYYRGKTTSCIDLPSEDDPKVMVPTVLVPRQRFHAPQSSVHYLLRCKPPKVKLLKEPRKLRPPKAAAPASAKPVPAPVPVPVPKAIVGVPESPPRDDDTTTKFDLAEVARTMGDENAKSAEDVLASPSSDTEAAEAEEARPGDCFTCHAVSGPSSLGLYE